MASQTCSRSLRPLAQLFSKRPDVLTSVKQCTPSKSTRSMATVSETPIDTTMASESSSPTLPRTEKSTSTLTTSAYPNFPSAMPPSTITTTVYDFPTMAPLRFSYFLQSHLYLPLRKDILHRAVIYEGDKSRSGTASTKWRDDVNGSHRKLYQQKGTGKARVGDKQSPIRRGGGVAFGPKPRDFATKLPRKVYDLAWRTALSFRYRRGELVVVDKIQNPRTSASYWIQQIFERNGWGNKDGRSMLVAKSERKDNAALFRGMERTGMEGRLLTIKDVDVKNLLEMGRVIIEEAALKAILKEHSSDLVPTLDFAGGLTSAEDTLLAEEMSADVADVLLDEEVEAALIKEVLAEEEIVRST